jgi:protein-S-isoprenylcysteine O-methyltransferase Ste14
MEQLNFFGIGPKIGRITLPYLAVTIAVSILFPSIFSFGEALRVPLLVAGIIFIVIALGSYFSTLRLMLPGIRSNTLVTGGMYRFCRNPLYSALLLFLFPGLAFVMNSWIILTTSVVGCLVMKRFIREEEEVLERIFGDEYRAYRERTAWLFPNPFHGKRWK